jgi:hypothetical protein
MMQKKVIDVYDDDDGGALCSYYGPSYLYVSS